MKFRRKTYKLGEIIDLYDNLRIPLSSMEREGREKKYPYYGANGIIDYVDDYIFDGEYILLAEDGTVFIEDKYPVLHLTQGKFWVNNHAHVFKSKNEIANQNFLYYILKNTNIRAYVTGAVQLKINQRNLKKIKVTIPNLEVQKAIANILSSFDDKIEVNNKINKNLEELAQTLYKHWFVDFEFPNEEGKPYKSSGGKMIESELGPIPYGWEVKEQGEYFPIITGKKNANYSTDDGEFNFFTCSQQIFKAPGYSFEGSAILVAGNGDFNVKYYKGKFEAYQRTYVLIPHNEKLSGLLYFLIKENLSEITSGHRGSVIKFITKGDLDKYKIIMPKDIQFLEQMSRQFQNIINKIQHNNEENTKLAEMRDLLLPKLMSGEIRLPVEE